jgi:calcineurin-like phosphoesterase family protein
MLYFTSDTHFGHKKMLEFRKGFSAPWQMDEMLIKNWNKAVTDKDEIWHLGDVSFANWDRTVEILEQLRGRKHLVLGNHDHQYRNRYKDYFESVQDYKEVKWKGVSFILSHYPFLTWNRSHYGTIMLHGHCHGNLPQEWTRRFDVGVDTLMCDYKPISADLVIVRAEHFPISKYHHE